MKRRWILPGLAAAALGLRLYIHLASPLIAADAQAYLSAAERMRHLPWQEVVTGAEVHPLYPLLTWLLGGLVPDLALAAALISLAASTLTVWPLHALVRLRWPERSADATCLLFAFHPILAPEMADPLPTALQILLFVSAIACGLRALDGGPWLLYPAGGACAALAYLTRTEGLLSGLLLAGAAALTAWRRPAGFAWGHFAAGVAAAALAGALFAGPYVAALSRKAGRLTITAKGGGTVLLKAVQGEKLEVREMDVSYPLLPTLWRKFSYAFFAPLLPFLAAGFWLERRDTRRRMGHLLIALAALGPPVLLFLLNRHFRPSHRYFLTGVTLLLPWMAAGMLGLLDFLRRRYPAKPLPAAAAGALLLALLVGKNILPHRPEDRTLKEAGAWLAAHPPAPRPWTLVSSSDKLSWYAQADHVSLTVPRGADPATRALALCRAARAPRLALDGRSVDEFGGPDFLDALVGAGFTLEKSWPAKPRRVAVWIWRAP